MILGVDLEEVGRGREFDGEQGRLPAMAVGGLSGRSQGGQVGLL